MNGAPAEVIAELNKKTTTKDLEALLAAKFAQPEWSIAFEVSSAVGFGARRRTDALALANWASKGCRLVGFEIKVSLADLRKEIADPTKAAEVSRFCHGWYLVTTKELADVALREVPESWGILIPRAGGLGALRAPKFKEHVDTWTIYFLASVVRAFMDRSADVRTKDIDKRLEECRRKEAEIHAKGRSLDGKDAWVGRAQRAEDENQKLRAAINQLTGLKNGLGYGKSWDLLVAAMTVLMPDGWEAKRLREQAKRYAEAADVADEILKAANESPSTEGDDD